MWVGLFDNSVGDFEVYKIDCISFVEEISK